MLGLVSFRVTYMLHLVAKSTPPQTAPTPQLQIVSPTNPTPASRVVDFALIAARRCSSFFAEAAVLVLVFGILDFCLLKGRIEPAWIVGALAISVGLLATSIATDFAAHTWLKSHP